MPDGCMHACIDVLQGQLYGASAYGKASATAEQLAKGQWGPTWQGAQGPAWQVSGQLWPQGSTLPHTPLHSTHGRHTTGVMSTDGVRRKEDGVAALWDRCCFSCSSVVYLGGVKGLMCVDCLTIHVPRMCRIARVCRQMPQGQVPFTIAW